MHDYSRDIMLANAQQDMEVTLAKMQLAKKVALTKANTDKAGMLKKQNDELGYMFVPTQVWHDRYFCCSTSYSNFSPGLSGADPRKERHGADTEVW